MEVLSWDKQRAHGRLATVLDQRIQYKVDKERKDVLSVLGMELSWKFLPKSFAVSSKRRWRFSNDGDEKMNTKKKFSLSKNDSTIFLINLLQVLHYHHVSRYVQLER